MALLRKLGLKPGMQACVLQPPEDYFELLGELPEGAVFHDLKGSLDFIHYFAMFAGQLSTELPDLLEHLDPKGMLWISWPKKSSGMQADLGGNEIRNIIRPKGLIDVKVCAVDEMWSAAKFVWRKK